MLQERAQRFPPPPVGARQHLASSLPDDENACRHVPDFRAAESGELNSPRGYQS